jgi:hypothetical protein
MADAKDSMDIEHSDMVMSVEAEAPRPPRTHVDSAPLPTDSMVTVPLSEGTAADEDDAEESVPRPEIVIEERRNSSRLNSSEILKAFGRRSSQASIDAPATDSPSVSIDDVDAPESPESRGRSRRGSDGSGKSEPVDWAELERKEEQEPEGEGQDKVSSRHKGGIFG